MTDGIVTSGREPVRLGPEVRATLTKQAELELAHRSLAGIAVYVVVSLVLAVCTPYLHDDPAVLLGAVALFAVIGGYRLWCAKAVTARYDEAPELWRRRFRAGAYASGILSGALFCVTVALYAWEWTAMLLVIVMSAIIAGASTSLAPDLKLARWYVAMLFGPTIVWCLADASQASVGMAVLLSMNVAYQFAQAGKQHGWYWRAAEDNALLQLKTAQLEEARNEAEAANAAKSLFLANMSHEVRTPLHVILGMTDIVLDGSLADEQRENLARARRAAIALLSIINDILDASKIEAGKMTIEVVEMDLRQVVEDAVALLAPAAAGKGLSLCAVIAPELPGRLKGDPVRVRQTLVNLVGNAVKFTDTGSVTVRVLVLRRSASHVVVRLDVVDTGIGVPVDRRSAVFDSFAQADVSTTRLYGGTGLGLAISRQLVTLMGGRIGLESEPGCGSTFWIELGFECASPERDAAAA